MIDFQTATPEEKLLFLRDKLDVNYYDSMLDVDDPFNCVVGIGLRLREDGTLEPESFILEIVRDSKIPGFSYNTTPHAFAVKYSVPRSDVLDMYSAETVEDALGFLDRMIAAQERGMGE